MGCWLQLVYCVEQRNCHSLLFLVAGPGTLKVLFLRIKIFFKYLGCLRVVKYKEFFLFFNI